MKKNKPKKKHFTLESIAIGSILISLTVVFLLIESFIPRFSTGGTIEIHFLPIIIAALIFSFPFSVTFAIISSLLEILLVPAGSGFLINPIQVILDYNLPYLSPSIVFGILKLILFKKNFLFKFNASSTLKQIIFLQFGLFFIFLFNYISHVISGAVYFAPSNTDWSNWKAWANSFFLNSYYVVGTYLVFSLILVWSIIFIVNYYQSRFRNQQNIAVT